MHFLCECRLLPWLLAPILNCKPFFFQIHLFLFLGGISFVEYFGMFDFYVLHITIQNNSCAYFLWVCMWVLFGPTQGCMCAFYIFYSFYTIKIFDFKVVYVVNCKNYIFMKNQTICKQNGFVLFYIWNKMFAQKYAIFIAFYGYFLVGQKVGNRFWFKYVNFQ